jgi:STAM-binding protein
VDHEHTPTSRTQNLPPEDAAARAQAQREQFQAEERAREQAREQQRIAAEEAAKWKRQREQQQAQDDGERARRKSAAAAAARKAAATNAPDYTFPRAPNGYGSQSTVVLSDGRPPDEVNRQQQLQEQMRLREEQITKRQSEQKRKQEQEGIVRRQQEAEQAAQAVRQNLMPPPTSIPFPSNAAPSTSASVSPMFPNYTGSSTATTPSSNHYQRSPIEYPSIGSHLMPLENPSRYEGDSTDSESIHHHHHDHRHHYHKSPVKSTRRCGELYLNCL